MKVEKFMELSKKRVEAIFKDTLKDIWKDVKGCIQAIPEDLEIFDNEGILLNYEKGKTHTVGSWAVMDWIDSTETGDGDIYCGTEVNKKIRKEVTIFEEYDTKVVEVFCIFTDELKLYVKVKSDPSISIEKNDTILKDFVGYEGFSAQTDKNEKFVVFKFNENFFE